MASPRPALTISPPDDFNGSSPNSYDDYDSAIDDYYGSTDPPRNEEEEEQHHSLTSNENKYFDSSPPGSPVKPSPSSESPNSYFPQNNYHNQAYGDQVYFQQPSEHMSSYVASASLNTFAAPVQDPRRTSILHLSPQVSEMASPHSSSSANAAVAVMAQEMSAVQALKRLSIGAMSTLDPDLPNYSSEFGQPRGDSASVPSRSQSIKSQTRSQRESIEFDFSNRPTRSRSAPNTLTNSHLLRHPSDSGANRQSGPENNVPQTAQNISTSQPNQLLWVPAHVHPEIAPQQWQSFVQGKLAEIKSTNESHSSNATLSSGSKSRPTSVSSLNSMNRRRKSRLSMQFTDQDSYTDGADVLEKRRSAEIGSQQSNDSTIQSLSHQLETLGELEGWSVHPAHISQSIDEEEEKPENSKPLPSHGELEQNSPVPLQAQIPLANDSDSPILPSPTSSLRRSTRTLYNKNSTHRGRRAAAPDTSNSHPPMPNIAVAVAADDVVPTPPASKDEGPKAIKRFPASSTSTAAVENTSNVSNVTAIDESISHADSDLTSVDSSQYSPPVAMDENAIAQQSNSKPDVVPEIAEPVAKNPQKLRLDTNRSIKDNGLLTVAEPTLQPVSPTSPMTPESDEESPNQSRSKGRKGTWGWLFKDNNGVNGAPGSGRNSPSIDSVTPEAGEPSSPTVLSQRSTSFDDNLARSREVTKHAIAIVKPEQPSDATSRKASNGSGISKDRISNFFSKKRSLANLKQRQEARSEDQEMSSSDVESTSSKPAQPRTMTNSRPREKPAQKPESDDSREKTLSTSTLQSSLPLEMAPYSPEAAAYYGAPYQIPAHQYSDKSIYMVNHRYAPHIERAIYRLSHLKLGNTKRPLVQQVLLSNFMYSYLNLINQGFIKQQQEALYKMQQEQQRQLEIRQKLIEKDPLYQKQQQEWQEHQKQQRKLKQQKHSQQKHNSHRQQQHHQAQVHQYQQHSQHYNNQQIQHYQRGNYNQEHEHEYDRSDHSSRRSQSSVQTQEEAWQNDGQEVYNSSDMHYRSHRPVS